VIRFSELVSKLTPSDYAQIALGLFVLVFLAVVLRISGKQRRTEHDACARLPLVDDADRRGERA
jgi:cbb3-type cytochrome oxidase subunit 3